MKGHQVIFTFIPELLFVSRKSFLLWVSSSPPDYLKLQDNLTSVCNKKGPPSDEMKKCSMIKMFADHDYGCLGGTLPLPLHVLNHYRHPHDPSCAIIRYHRHHHHLLELKLNDIHHIPHICHFFTRAKFLDNKIYTEKRQFFALNL